MEDNEHTLVSLISWGYFSPCFLILQFLIFSTFLVSPSENVETPTLSVGGLFTAILTCSLLEGMIVATTTLYILFKK